MKMRLRISRLLAVGFLLVFGWWWWVERSFAFEPNIIMIVSDDQGIDAVEGPTWPNTLRVHTPTLRSLAAQGVVFRNARVNSYCAPTRVGIMSGRSAIRTGVTGIPPVDGQLPDRDQVFLQGHETTIAEVLQGAGYYTIHADKWHCGWSADQLPLAQGFDVSFARQDYYHLDDPDVVGDEHLSRMVDLSVGAYLAAPPGPKALMFWTYVPHRREADADGLRWWRVDSSLHPSGEAYYDGPQNNRKRYRAVVEALDTEVGRLLFELGVIDANGIYRPESNTVVFYLGDNGTPASVAPRSSYAKGSLFEGGVRVPFFVFGAGVESGRIRNQLVSHVDLYDTIADIVGVPIRQRGSLLRDSISFADALGYGAAQPNRNYVVSSQGNLKPLLQTVSITDGRFKLVTSAGSVGLALGETNEFYDLLTDSLEENNLVFTGRNLEQELAFRRLLDALPNYWGTAVSHPLTHHIDVPLAEIMSLSSNDRVVVNGDLPLGFNIKGNGSEVENRVFMRFAIEQIDQLLPAGKTIADVVEAQVIAFFATDSPNAGETDTGLIRVHPMVMDWYSGLRPWDELVGGHYQVEVGSFDVAPHVIARPGAEGNRFSGVPMLRGCPISFTNHRFMPTLVKRWYDQPGSNRGVVLLADKLGKIGGDQRISLLPTAVLRLTLSLE